MNGTQKHLIALAQELDAACKKLGIPYVLHGSSAAWGNKQKGFLGNQCDIHLLMRAGDMEPLKKELCAQGAADRAVEDFSTNPLLAYNVMRYVDTSTTLAETESAIRYQCLGAALVIHPAFPAPLKGVARALETTMPYAHGAEEFMRFRMTDARAKTFETIMALDRKLGPAFLAKRCYKHLTSCKGKRSDKLCYVVSPQKVVTIPASMLTDVKLIDYAGIKLPVPANLKGYLKAHYGTTWKSKDAEKPTTSNRNACICYDDLPYEEALATMREDGIDFRAFQEELYQHHMDYCCRIRTLEGRAFDSYYRVRMSRSRIDEFIALEPKREELRKAAAEKDVATIKSLMANYLEDTDFYLDEMHVGYYVDDELMDIASVVWASEGRPNYAATVMKAAPKEFKEKSLREYLKDYL